jgi:integrase
MVNDMSARPHEILNLRISDIEFHISEEGKSYAEARITGGKTGSRTVPLIDSLPYLREWLQEHPSSSNQKTWLFISRGNNHGCKLTYDALVSRYEYYKKKYFPSLLNHETVPAPDKSFIMKQFQLLINHL